MSSGFRPYDPSLGDQGTTIDIDCLSTDCIVFGDGSTQSSGVPPNDLTWKVKTLSEIYSFDTGTETSSVRGVYLPENYPIMLVHDTTSLTIFEYDLVAPQDLSTTPVYNGVFITDVAGGASTGLWSDGVETRLTLVGFGNRITEWDLPTPGTIAGATNKTGYTVGPSNAVDFNILNGYRDVYYYLSNPNGDIEHWEMTTAGDWDTLVAVSGDTFSTGFTWSSGGFGGIRGDGRAAIISDPDNDLLHDGVLDIPNKISSMRLTSSKGVGPNAPQNGFVTANGKRVYTVPPFGTGSGIVTEFSMGILTSSVTADLVTANVVKPDVVEFLDSSTQTHAATPNLTEGRLETAILNQTFSLAAQDSDPKADFMRADGKKFYMAGATNDSVFEYDLSTAFDVSTLSFNQSYDFSTESTAPTGLYFKSDGTRMYVISGIPDGDIAQYDLSVAWDVSTAVFDAAFAVFSEDFSPANIVFKPDGNSFYMAGQSGNIIVRYDMSTPWDVTTSVFINSFAAGFNVQGMGMRADGKFLYISNDTTNGASEYALTIPWDVTTAELTKSVVLGFDARSINPTPYNHKWYTINFADDSVYEFDFRTLDTLYTSEGIIDMAPEGGRNVRLANADQGGLRFASDLIGSDRTIYYQDYHEIDLVASGVSGEERLDVSSVNGIQMTTGNSGIKPTIDTRDISQVASTTIEIFSASDLEDLATAGVITIPAGTALTLLFNTDSITSATRFVGETDSQLRIASINSKSAYLYSGTSALFSGLSIKTDIYNVNVTATSTGDFLDLTLSAFGLMRIENCTITGFDALGAITGGFLFWRFTSLVSIGGQLTMIDTSIAAQSCAFFFAPLTGTLFSMAGTPLLGNGIISCGMTMIPGTSFIRIDPDFSPTSPFLINNNALPVGELFDTTGGSTGTFTAVADASITAQGISSVTDSSGVARFNWTPGPTVYVGQEVVNSGYVTNTAYNGTFTVTAVGIGFFEVSSIAFGTDEASGSFDSDSVTLTDTTTTLSDGDTLTIDTEDATDYDGGATVYNQLTNTFQINRTFTATQTGSWDTSGIDHSDPRILAANNPGFEPSHYIAAAFVNDNATANGAIVNNTFTDMVFDTGGSALIAGSTIERWKLIDELNGTLEYTGNEPFDGYITFDFTVISSGGSVDFRFKWQHDVGAGFVDLPDAVEVLQNVGSSSSNASKTFPLRAVKGDQIKPQVTRNSGTSGITTSYATLYASQ